MSKTDTTRILEIVGLQWLFKNNCVAMATECQLSVWGGIADIVGVKANGSVYYLEVKSSKRDLHSWKQKRVDAQLSTIMFNKLTHPYDFTYFVLAAGLSLADDEYPEWGVINSSGEVVRKAKRRKYIIKDMMEIWKKIAHTCTYRAYDPIGIADRIIPEFVKYLREMRLDKLTNTTNKEER